MNNDAKCVKYETDYKEIVKEIRDLIQYKKEHLSRLLDKETNAIKFIEINAKINEILEIENRIIGIVEYCNCKVRESE